MMKVPRDHGFVIKEYSLHWYEAFWESPKHCRESYSSNIVSWYFYDLSLNNHGSITHHVKTSPIFQFELPELKDRGAIL